MKVTIDIIDRNYEQIKDFCEYNKINVEDYVVQCVEDDFFTRKYGDLNDKFSKEEPKIEESPKEEEAVVKKKPGRPKKSVKEDVIKEEENNIEEQLSNLKPKKVRSIATK